MRWMTSLGDVLIGSQVPTLQTNPPYRSSAGAEVVELASTVGLNLDPWQRHVLEVALGEAPDGRWATSTVGLVVARQNGKGSVLEALELAHLFLFGTRLIIHTAQQMRPVAVEHFRRILELIDASDDLSRRVLRVGRANGDEGIELRGGQRIRFVARSDTTARGMSGDLVVLDEAITVTHEQLAALMPTMSARPNPQVWFTSSAALSTSSVLHGLRRRALADDRGLAYFEWAASREDVDVDDEAEWARANPALGIRIPVDAIRRERDAMTASTFRRERLSIPDAEPPPPDERVGMPVDAWRRCLDPSSTVDPLVFTVEVAEDRDRAAIGVAGRTADGRTHVEVIEWTPNVPGVPGRLAELVARYRVPVVLVANTPAASLRPELVRLGVAVEDMPRVDVGPACGAFVDAVVAGEVVHIGQPVLEVAVAEAVRRTVGDVWVWDRRGRRDVTPLVAVTSAAWWVRRPEPEPPAPFFAY